MEMNPILMGGLEGSGITGVQIAMQIFNSTLNGGLVGPCGP